MVVLLIVLSTSYLLGSIPSGHIAGRLAGVDVRKHGSGNIGATNVLRVLGKPWGLSVFFVDALKGFVAVRFAIFMCLRNSGMAGYAEFCALLAAATCVAGHSFPVWLRFKGGKGVATSAGALLGIVPTATIVIFLVWLTTLLISRYVSVASMLAALALPIVVAALGRSPVLILFSAAMTALVIARHRSNIARLRAGTEQRLGRE
jgi:glycerol-3-phosphate acyltransferase PlsY